jgi:hypothetical protein
MMIRGRLGRVTPPAWIRLRMLSLAGLMPPTLILFAAAGDGLPSRHWVLVLGPLPVLALGAAFDEDPSGGGRRPWMCLVAAALPPTWALGTLVSLCADATVPSIIWFLWAIAALASVTAALSFGAPLLMRNLRHHRDAPDNNQMQLTSGQWQAMPARS